MEKEKEKSLSDRLLGCTDGEHCFETTTFKFMTYCNVCMGLLWGLSSQGKKCVFCRFVCHEKCQADAMHSFPCKRHAEKFTTNTKHHWVRGNLIGLGSVCCGCDAMIVLPAAPVALGKYYRCSYCSRKVHEDCMVQVDEVCDGGKFGNNVILPHELSFKDNEGDTGVALTHFQNPEEKSPMLVFTNSKSGAAQGDAVLQSFCSYLNKYQMYDLADGGPKKGLERFRDVKNLRIIACGGDGTFGWLQSAIDEAGMKHRPIVGHFALGTGNDMSRSLGFGPGYAGEPIKKILAKFAAAEVGILDRWTVTFNGKAHGYTPALNNYFGIGVDAQVAHKFHTTRNSHPEQFQNRTINKMKYVAWGATASLKNLFQDLELFCDGERVDIPENCQAIAILNIECYASGQKLWDQSETKEFGHQSIGDGLLEVVSLRGSQDIGLAAVGIKPTRLAQAKHVKLVTTKELPVQLDGEPWLQEPCTIELSLRNKVKVLISQEGLSRKSSTVKGIQDLQLQEMDQQAAMEAQDEYVDL